MKTIVCPTDPSRMATNAAQYAHSLAHLTHAALRLLNKPSGANLFRNPHLVSTAAQSFTAPSYQKLPTQVSVQTFQIDPTIQIQTVGTLAKLAHSEQANLIIMGVEKEFSINDMYAESIVNLVKQAQCPALFLPEGVIYKHVKRIIVVMDHEAKITHRINFLAELASLFQAEILFLQVTKAHPEEEHYFETMMEMYLSFPYKYSSFHTRIHTCIAAGIQDFIAKVGADLVTVIPDLQDHLLYSYATSLCSEQYVAKPLDIPLLAIDSAALASANAFIFEYN
jgi:hypothetical protein